MTTWSVVALATASLFSAALCYFAVVRIPAWRAMSWSEFQPDFARWARRADIVQPALLVGCLLSTIGMALGARGDARTLTVLAAVGFLGILLGSAAVLVPLQRRLIRQPDRDTGSARERWYEGHLVRTAVGLTSFTLLALAAL